VDASWAWSRGNTKTSTAAAGSRFRDGDGDEGSADGSADDQSAPENLLPDLLGTQRMSDQLLCRFRGHQQDRLVNRSVLSLPPEADGNRTQSRTHVRIPEAGSL